MRSEEDRKYAIAVTYRIFERVLTSPGGVPTVYLPARQARVLKMQEAAMETVNKIYGYEPVKVIMYGRPKTVKSTV